MSKPGIIYRITSQSFHETADIQCIVDISDTDFLIDDSDDPEIRELAGAGSPIELSVIDNNEEPFTPIRAQQLTVRFLSDYNYNMSSFLGGSDQRWQVHYYKGTDDKTIFKGYVVKENISEDFMPVPNVVEIVANDNIGLLKEIPLTNDDELNPVGYYKIMDLIAMIMKKTGHSLPFLVAYNIKNEGLEDDISSPNANDEHFFTNNYIDAKTFELEVGSCENCYSALQKLLGNEATIFQWAGYWVIKRIDEVEHPTRGLYMTEFDADGVFVANLGEITFDKSIGNINDVWFSEASTLVIAEMAHKKARLDYDYNTPREIIENIDFDRGELIETVSATEKKYTIEDWVTGREEALVDEYNSADIYVRKIYNAQGDILEKYIVIEAGADLDFILSSRVPVHQKDKFTIDLERRMSADAGGSGFYRENPTVKVKLYGDDGTFWTCEGRTSVNDVAQWVQCTSTFRSDQHFLVIEGDDSEDQTEAKNLYSGEVPEIPVDGIIRIQIYKSSRFGDTAATYINNVRLDYHPYIAGAYDKFTGHYNQASQDGDYKKVKQDDVFIASSPRRNFKGALHITEGNYTVFSGAVDFSNPKFFTISGYRTQDFFKGQILIISGTTNNNMTTRVTSVEYGPGTGLTIVRIEDDTVVESDGSVLIESPVFELANLYYNAAVYPSGVGGDNSLLHTFGHIQIFDVWNQYKNVMRVFQANCQGCDLEKLDSEDRVNLVHLIHKYTITDFSQSGHTLNRFFQLLSFNQNHRNGGWSGTMREVFNTTIAKDYSNHEFNYKTN